MPRIVRLQLMGLKANDLDVTLGPLNLVLGRPGSGKTAILTACQYAALGHVPHLGKTAAATERLMRGSASAMSVKVTLDDGRTFERTLRRTGATRSRCSTSWLDRGEGAKAKPEEHVAAARGLFGSNEADVTEALDLSKLLEATGSTRSQRLEDLLDATGLAPDELARRGRAYLLIRLDRGEGARHLPPGTEALERMAETALPMIGLSDPGTAAALRAAAVDVADELEQALRGGSIGAAHALVSRRSSEEHAKVDGKSKAHREAEDLLRRHGAVEDLPALEQLRDRALAEQAVARRDLAHGEEGAAGRKAVADRLPGLREEARRTGEALAAALARMPRAEAARKERAALVDPPELAAPPPVDADPAALEVAGALEEQAKLLDDQVQALEQASPLPAEPNLVEVEQLEARAEALEAEAAALVEPAEVSTAAEAGVVERAAAALESAKASPWRDVETTAGALRKVKGASKDEGKIVRAAVKLLEHLAGEHGGSLADAVAVHAAAERELAAAEGRRSARDEEAAAVRRRRAKRAAEAAELRELAGRRLGALQAAHEEMVGARRARLRDVQDQARALRTEALEVRTRAMEAAGRAHGEERARYARAFGERAAEAERVRLARVRLDDEASAIEEEAAAAQRESDRAAAELREVEARLEGMAAGTADVEEARGREAAAAAAFEELGARLDKAREAHAAREFAQRLIAEISRATALEKAYGEAEWALKRLRLEDVAVRVEPIVARMRTFLGPEGAGLPEVPFIVTGSDACEFGWRTPAGDAVTVETLSGAEFVLFAGAFVSALLALRQPEVKLLLLEENDVGLGVELGQLFRGCEAVSRAYGIQVLLASNLPIEAPEGWSTIRTSAAPSPLALASPRADLRVQAPAAVPVEVS